MPSYKQCFVTLVAMIGIFDLVRVTYYDPDGKSILGWGHEHLKKLHEFSHSCADVICNDPQLCKNASDKFFKMADSIPKDFLKAVGRFIEKHLSKPDKDPEGEDDAMISNSQGLQGAVQWDEEKPSELTKTNDVPGKVGGGENKAASAAQIIKSLRFSKYKEHNLCKVKQGISKALFDSMIEKIAALTNMPNNLKEEIKSAKDLADGDVLALDNLEFENGKGGMVFGRVAVVRRGKVFDLALSIHTMELELKTEQDSPSNADQFANFTRTLGKRNQAFDGMSFELRTDFLEFFHTQAIAGFTKKCKFVLKALEKNNGKERVLDAFYNSPSNPPAKQVGNKSEEGGKKSEEVGKKSEKVGKKSEQVGESTEATSGGPSLSPETQEQTNKVGDGSETK